MTDTARGKLDGLARDFVRELRENLLPYWMNTMVDEAQGGFYGRRNGNNNLVPGAPKGVILNTRILWTFSAAARHFHDVQYLSAARRAYDFLLRHFVDPEYGGVYWMVDAEGNAIETKKQVYAQAFAVYALAEYHLATGSRESLDHAIQIFEHIESRAWDESGGGYFEAYDREWHLLDDLRLSEKDANEKKTMNTHLHLLEAYTLFYKVWKNERVGARLRALIGIFLGHIINPRHQYDLFFDEQWTLRSTKTSFGHDIEGSWLLCAAADALDDHALQMATRERALATCDVVLREGLDEDGGIMNETEPGELIDTDKHWWPQAEAIVGFVNAWQISGKEEYITAALRVWGFIQGQLVDRDHGEWHWMVHRDGRVNTKEDKAGPWKGPYHSGRAAMEVRDRCATK